MKFPNIYKLVDESDLVKLTTEMVKIPSITGEEGDMAEFMAEKMMAIGFDVNKFEAETGRPNIVGVLRGERSNKKLLLNGHMDIVPPGDPEKWKFDPYKGEVHEGKIYGRGSCDMKGGLASILTAIKSIQDSGLELKGDLIFTAVVDEERGSYKGTKHVLDIGIRSDQAFIAEPTKLNIVVAHKGDLGLDITVYGRAAHAANPEMGLNAIHKMIPVIENILKLSDTYNWDEKVHRRVGAPTVSISVIKGGTQRNIVPDRCSIIVDRRIVPCMETIEDARQQIEMELNKLRGFDPQFEFEIKTILEVEAYEISEEEPVVQTLKKSFIRYMGREPKIEGVSYFTDAHFLVNQGGIPTVMFGPGSIDQAHAVDEYVEINQLVNASKVYAIAIAETLG